ncbi:MAG: 30S ribosomal protein S4, partial [Simkania sp.]|nr:30S ribosomal protein S4 [Simkania sp.]
MRHTYNISEKQFKGLVLKAKNAKGNSGDVLLQLCETRMDNLVWKMGFTPSIFAARQAIVHRHFTLNGKPHNIPSTRLRPGDKVGIRLPEAKSSEFLRNQIKGTSYKVNPPAYVEVEADQATGVLARLPEVDEIPQNALADKVIEFYSR